MQFYDLILNKLEVAIASLYEGRYGIKKEESLCKIKKKSTLASLRNDG